MKSVESFKVEHNDVEYLITVEFNYTIDDQYGADADGGRATTRVFLDDITILEVIRENSLEVVEYDKDFREAIEHAARVKFLN